MQNGVFEWKLGERGNSGCALRAPMFRDPAFDGMELQMADFRYNTSAKDSELTAGIYRAIAPTRQVYKPTEWNRYQVTLQGRRLTVLRHEVDSLQRQVDSLSRWKRAIETDPVVQERLAREEFGMVKGGKEMLYRFAEDRR